MKTKEEKLDRLLMEWKSEIPPLPEVESEVWRRIAKEEEAVVGTVVPFGSFRRAWTGAAAAAALFLGATFVGAGLAELQKKRTTTLVSLEASEEAYFESVNPVALARHSHQR